MRILLTVFLLSALVGCITETDRPARKVDQSVVVQKQVDLGIGYLRRGEYSRAKQNLNKALQMDPRSAMAHTTLGLIFQAEGEPELAEEHFENAIRFEPQLSSARNNYGAFLFSLSRYEDAVEQLVIAANDRYYQARPLAFENLGSAYLMTNQLTQADHALTRAVQLNPSQGRALLELADIRFQQQGFAEAWGLYNRHVRVAPQSARSLWLCIQLSDRLSSQDEKASCILSLRNIFPASREYSQYQERFER